MRSDATSVQLSLIEETHDLLVTAQIPHWLFGGWALDFVVGTVIRHHDDIEFLIWKQDCQRLERLLDRHNYVQLCHPYPDEDIIWEKRGQKLEFYFLVRNENGQIVTPGRWARWPWPDDAFSAEPGRIEHIVCPVISIGSLLSVKEGYQDYTGTPPRPKDLADMEYLRRIIHSETQLD